MISCEQHDYIEIACLNRLEVELRLRNGTCFRGVAFDTAYNADKEECVVLVVGTAKPLIVLDQVSLMRAITPNLHFDSVIFD